MLNDKERKWCVLKVKSYCLCSPSLNPFRKAEIANHECIKLVGWKTVQYEKVRAEMRIDENVLKMCSRGGFSFKMAEMTNFECKMLVGVKNEEMGNCPEGEGVSRDEENR